MGNFLNCWGKGKIKEIIQFRIGENVDLLDAITWAVKNFEIRSAVIISGLGALNKVVCRNLKWFPKQYPIKDKDRIFYEIERPSELLALSGWVARKGDNEPEVHAHFSV